ncbi:hypothetical protein B9G53_09085 [Pseudanabaena sp. SR411]|nr:hypothetical protein B9G53_09085 [Pseudanabaena sp. SR411]
MELPVINSLPRDLLSVISRNPLIVAPELNVIEAIALMDQNGSSYVLVSKENSAEVMGILTARDIIRLNSQRLPLDQLSVQTVMSHPVITLQTSELTDINTAINVVMTLFQEHSMRHLPVLEGDRLVGVLEKENLTELFSQPQNRLEIGDRQMGDRQTEDAEFWASEQRSQKLFDALPKISVQGYNSDRQVIYWNSASEKIYGYTADEALGQNLEALIIPPPMREVVINLVDAWVNGGEPIPASELTLMAKDGSSVFVYSSHVLLNNPRNEPELYCIDIDLSDHKKSEFLIKTQNQILQKIALGVALPEILNDIVVAIEGQFEDGLCSIMLCNSEGRLYQGFNCSRLPKNYTEVIKTLTIAEGNGSCGTAAYRKELVIVSDIATDPLWQNCKELALANNLRSCWSVPVIDAQDQVLGTFVVYHHEICAPTPVEIEVVNLAVNITRIAIESEQAMQTLQQLNQTLESKVVERTLALQNSNAQLIHATRLKDEFLANMSHELRTPLNAILGISESLQEGIYGLINELQNSAIAMIENSGNHLLSLINDILELSKIEAGKLELDIAPVSVVHLCESSLNLIRQMASKKNIQLRSSWQDDLGVISIDERRMRQVLINLLNNAVKFTPEGGEISLEVYLEMSELCLAIADTGIGIAATNLDQLFQPFVQIDASLNRQYEGTGLGLSLAKEIVELHGGSISVRSELGKGSCFIVRLPYHLVTEIPTLAKGMTIPTTSSTSSLTHQSETSPLILIAEDNQSNIDILVNYLEFLGYRFEIAKNGQEAIEMVKSNQPDLILMDIQMPIMDGLEATKQIRLDLNLVNIPIIALTALAMAGDRDRCIAAGANEYFSKPIRLKELSQMIQTLLATQKRYP